MRLERNIAYVCLHCQPLCTPAPARKGEQSILFDSRLVFSAVTNAKGMRWALQVCRHRQTYFLLPLLAVVGIEVLEARQGLGKACLVGVARVRALRLKLGRYLRLHELLLAGHEHELVVHVR